MKTYCLTLAVLVSLAAAAPQPSTQDASYTAKELRQGYSDQVVLAKPRPARRQSAEAEETREGLRIAQRFARFGDLRVIELPAGDTADQAIERLRASGRYEFVEPNHLRQISATPNDPDFGRLWGLLNTGQDRGTAGADISATAAWDIRRDAPGVIVAVIDTGVNLQHADIAPNLWRNPSPGAMNDLHGARFTNGTGRSTSGDPSDDQGHGTHVAGTIGAVGNNGLGVAGVAWNVQIMALKYLTASGTGSTADSISCIDYAIAHGAHIINASYGANGGSPITQSELEAISRARDAGIIFVAAAGNESANMDISPHYPASYRVDNIVSVGASTRTDELAVFTNYGAAVDLFAPGNDIVSLDYEKPAGGTSLKSGTSMAAPHVAGALALLKAQFPGDTYRQLINRVLRGVDVGPKFTGQAQTNGRLNLRKALTTTTNRPFNDGFAERPLLASDNLNIRTNNAGATADPGEPAHAGAAATASLWWQWTAAGNAPVEINTAGTGFDTVVAVYTGTTVGGLTLVAANDNDGSNVTSKVAFTAQAGTSYQVVVDGKNGATGAIFLTLNAAPSNDNFATPITLTGQSTHVTATNTLTTREPGEPTVFQPAGNTSLWYRWTAPKSGRFQIGVFAVDFNPVLAVFTGSAIDALTVVTSNDNTGFDGSQRQSLCTFDAVAGTTYRILVDAMPGGPGAATTGQFTLNLVDSVWQASTGTFSREGEAVTGGPAVAPDGTVYFGAVDRAVYAVNPDGTLKWRFATTGGPGNSGGSIDTASPAVAEDGTVYVGNSVGRFFALTPNGAVRWTRDFGSSNSASISPAIAANGTVYIKVGDGRLYALDPANGATRWSFDIGGRETYASPVVALDGTIYQGSSDRNLYAISPDGTLRWKFATDSTGEVYSTPAIDAAGNVYFGVLNSGKFYSVTSGGTLRWTYTGSFESISSSPALSADGGTVYFGSYDRRIHALNTGTGEARWTYQMAEQVRASSPAVDANGVVYIGSYDFRIYAVNADGTLLRTYDTGGVVRSSPVIFGRRLYVGSNDRKVYAFDLAAGPASGIWPQYRANPQRTGRMPTTLFAISGAPQSQAAVMGRSLTLSVTATGPGPITYEWRKDGVTIAGATGATLTVPSVSAATAGSYTVTVRSPQGTLTTGPAIITVITADAGRLANLSVRTTAGTDAQTLTVGFVVSGTPDKTFLIRAIGPTLAVFGVTGALADPSLQLFSGPTVLMSNDNWFNPSTGSGAAVATVFASTGAFALDSNSRDAAIVRALSPGSYTAQITGASTQAGIALAELYDTTPDAGARLVNVSARAQVGTGTGILIAGFNITGNVPKQVLIRGIGPALSGFGVAGTLANPRLDVYSDSAVLHSNDNWGGTPALTAAFAQVGAFALANASSADAALLVTLDPGTYTAQVSGVNGTTGVALVEIYEMP